MKEANSLVLHRLIFFVILLSLGIARGYGQNAERQKTVFPEEQTTKTAPTVPLLAGPALEGPVDPTKYFVGPSDILAVNIWTSPPINFTLTVTPEGSLIIPGVAEVQVADMTLAEAKVKIVAAVKEKFLIGRPTVTLLVPRSVVVSVTGYVRFPGSYTLHSIDRVDKAIQAASEPPKDIQPTLQGNDRQEKQIEPEDQSKRNIWLKHRDGSVGRVDLTKFYAEKSDRWNPYLREGDEIVVPKLGQNRGTIGVYGAFNSPGSFELVDGDRLTDATKLAHGYSNKAILDSVVLTRSDSSGHQLIDLVLDARGLTDTSFTNILLQPGDRLVAKERPESRADFHVSIEGEVLYPGTYPITKDRTRISEILRKAGGFTEYASPSSGEIVRKSTPVDDLSFDRAIASRGNTLALDSAYIRLENEIRLRRQLVDLDFKKLIEQKDTTQDIVLQSGDRIIIPSMRKTVFVFGQVANPGNVTFVPGKTADYYITKAGGYTDNARTGGVAVIKRNTRQWLDPGETEVEDGDYIWVPKVIKQDLSYYLTLLGQAATVISAAVTVLIVVKTYK